MLLKKMKTIGALVPSSKYLALEMLRFVDKSKKQDIIEIGAGTGAVTKYLVNNRHPDSHIDVVEILQSRADLLSEKFKDTNNISIHNQNILNFEHKKYDLIIATIPFNNLGLEVLKKTLQKIKSLSKEQCIMSFFEYKMFLKLAPIFFKEQNEGDFLKVRKTINDFITKYEFASNSIFLNIPPAVVHHLKFNVEKQ